MASCGELMCQELLGIMCNVIACIVIVLACIVMWYRAKVQGLVKKVQELEKNLEEYQYETVKEQLDAAIAASIQI